VKKTQIYSQFSLRQPSVKQIGLVEKGRAETLRQQRPALNMKPSKEAPMSLERDRRNPPADQVYSNKARLAADAFSAHCAMVSLEAIRPELKHNPAWTVLRQDAYENFTLAFEAVQ